MQRDDAETAFYEAEYDDPQRPATFEEWCACVCASKRYLALPPAEARRRGSTLRRGCWADALARHAACQLGPTHPCPACPLPAPNAAGRCKRRLWAPDSTPRAAPWREGARATMLMDPCTQTVRALASISHASISLGIQLASFSREAGRRPVHVRGDGELSGHGALASRASALSPPRRRGRRELRIPAQDAHRQEGGRHMGVSLQRAGMKGRCGGRQGAARGGRGLPGAAGGCRGRPHVVPANVCRLRVCTWRQEPRLNPWKPTMDSPCPAPPCVQTAFLQSDKVAATGNGSLW